MAANLFKKHPTLTIITFNIALLLLIFIVFEILLRFFAPDWLKYRMKTLNVGELKGYGTDANWKVKYKNGQFYSFEPNSTFKIYHIEYENTVHINALGARSNGVGEDKDTNNIIPFIGDSYVMGVGVEDNETMVALTKKALGYNFLNLGVAGTCLPVQRKIIDNRYDSLGRPPAVIFAFLLDNDFDDIIKVHTLENPDSVLAVNKTSAIKESGSENGSMWKLNDFVNNNSFLKKLYTLQYLKQKILNIKNKGKAKDMESVYHMIYTKDTGYIQQATKYLDMELQLLIKEPYKPIVFIIPDRDQLNSSIRKNMCTYYGLNEKDIDPFLPNKIIIKALQKYNITYIDPTNCLINHQNEGPLYYTKDKHFTKLGHQAISECIENFLKTSLNDLNIKPFKK